jgi:hypothetical protein
MGRFEADAGLEPATFGLSGSRSDAAPEVAGIRAHSASLSA